MQNVKRVISFLLSAATVLSLCSFSVMAEGMIKAKPATPPKTDPSKAAASTQPAKTTESSITENGEKKTVTTEIKGNEKTVTTTVSDGVNSSSITITTTVDDAGTTTAKKGTPDTKPPVLGTVSVNSKTVTAPGTVEFTASATDDVSGVKYVAVLVKSRDYDKEDTIILYNKYYSDELLQEIPYEDGLFHGTMEISEFEPTGIYVVDAVGCTDIAGNDTWYHRESNKYRKNEKLLSKEQMVTFSVKNG